MVVFDIIAITLLIIYLLLPLFAYLIEKDWDKTLKECEELESIRKAKEI